jgi:tRNA(adenine34) deaminase
MVFNEAVRSDDELYMREALLEAEQAALAGEVPVGAVIVRDGKIISRAHNLVETMKSSSAHAEMLALDAAEKALGAKWLSGCTVYVTLEPCSMCAGAMVLARVSRLVFGASDPKAGGCGSVTDIAANERLNHRIDITAGVLGEECSRQLKEFFRTRRNEQYRQRRNS